MKVIIAFIVLLVLEALAIPLEQRAASCPADVDPVILQLLRPINQAAASEFCSTYIQPVVTSTSTINQLSSSVVTVTLPPLTSTTTVFSTIIESTVVTSTIAPPPETATVISYAKETEYHTDYETTMTTVTAYTGTSTHYVKRAQSTLPSFLASFATSDVSSACSRIVTPTPSTTTVTSTTVSIADSTSTITPAMVVATSVSIITVQTTDTVTLSLPQSTVTDYSVSSSIETVTATTVQITNTKTVDAQATAQSSTMCGAPVQPKAQLSPWISEGAAGADEIDFLMKFMWPNCVQEGAVSIACGDITVGGYYEAYCYCYSERIMDNYIPVESSASPWRGWDSVCF